MHVWLNDAHCSSLNVRNDVEWPPISTEAGADRGADHGRGRDETRTGHGGMSGGAAGAVTETADATGLTATAPIGMLPTRAFFLILF